MSNDIQQSNEMQNESPKDFQGSETSLSDNSINLDNSSTSEMEEIDLKSTKSEEEKCKKSSGEITSEDEKNELKAVDDEETSSIEESTKSICTLEKEKENTENTIDTLENNKNIVLMEKKLLEQKESSLNTNLTTLFEETFKYLKAWDSQLRNREKSLVAKAEKVKGLVRRTVEVYDILPEMNDEETVSEVSEKSDDASYTTNDLLSPVEGNHLVGGHDLPYALNLKTNTLQSKKKKLYGSPESGNEVDDEKKQLKYYQLLERDSNKKKESMLNALSNAIHPGGHVKYTLDGPRLHHAGWTVAKIQRLYMKYFRAESFRKALAYQKRYLTLMVPEDNQQLTSFNGKRKPSFKVGAWAVIAIIRMKKLVKKYQHGLRITSKYQKAGTPKRKEKKRNVKVSDVSGTSGEESSEVHPVNTFKQGSNTSPLQSDDKSPYLQSSVTNRIKPSSHATDRLRQTESVSNRDEVIEESNSDDSDVTNVDNALPRSNILLPDSSVDNMCRAEEVPKSYPRPVSRSYEVVEDSMVNSYPRCLDRTTYTSTPLSSPPTVNINFSDEQELEDTDASLNSYMRTLEKLQEKLKNVGFYKHPDL